MLNRRTVLATSSAAAIAGSQVARARAAENTDVKIDPYDQTPEQKVYHSLRFPKLDHEGYQDFVKGFKTFQGKQRTSREGIIRLGEFLRSKGLATGETDLDYEECFHIMMEDPSYAASIRLETSCQHLMWDRAQRTFHNDADKYLAAMEATDNSGPGTLELNPGMVLPEYTIYEIHAQPGGYVGDPFAGWIYHYAVTIAFYQGRNDFEAIHLSIAQSHPIPRDGKVLRILDVGCGTGESTTAIKERFPNAEVWGIEVGGPMVRYAHHRAVNMNLDINFAQRLAEDTKFPDEYFDIVTCYILMHEVDGDAGKKIASEMKRILRPGGVFNMVDGPSNGHPTSRRPTSVRGKAGLWVTYRYYVEPWYLVFIRSNYQKVMAEAGFIMDLDGPAVSGRPRVHGYKPA